MKMRRFLRALLLMLLCGLFPPDRSDANRPDERVASFLVSVFDCYMPVPNDFVLQTGDPSRVTLSLRSKTEVTRLVISEYKEALDESFVRTSSSDASGIVVEEFSVRSPFREDVDVVRLHDGKQQMFIYGEVDGLVDSLLHGCHEAKRGTLYEE